MQPHVDRRSALIPPALATVGLVWLTARALWTGAGASGWLFWPLLVAEAFALARLVVWTARVSSPAEGQLSSSADQGVRRDAADGAVLDVDVAVLAMDDHDPEQLGLSMLSAHQVTGARGVMLVGPAGQELDEIAARAGARRIVASGDLCALALAAVDAEGDADGAADLLAFVASGSVAHHDLVALSRPHFADESVGWLQSMSTPAPDRTPEATTFNDVTGPADGDAGVAPWAVDASVVRRSSFASDAPERDDAPAPLATATRTGRRSSVATVWTAWVRGGWAGRWSDVSLAVANGPESRRDAAATTADWARLRALPSLRGPLLARRLGARARLATVGSLADSLTGLAALAVVAVLSASLLTGRLPIDAGARWALVAGVAVHALTALVRWQASGRRIGGFESARAAFASIDRSLAVSASAVAGRTVGARVDRVRVAFVATAVLLFALGARAVTELTGWPLPDMVGADMARADLAGADMARAGVLAPGTVTADRAKVDVVLLLFAGVSATAPLLRAIDVIVPTRRRRSSSRAVAAVDVTLGGLPVDLVDLGPTGIGVRTGDARLVGATVPVSIALPGRPEPLRVPGVVRSAVELEDDSVRLGIQFVAVPPATQDRLMAFWAASWVPSAASARHEVAPPRTAADLKVTINRRSNPALRLLAALTLVATGAAGLPPYGVASADEPVLPPNTFALVKDVRGIGPAGVETQGSALVGAEMVVELDAHNTWAPTNPDQERYHNVTVTDVVPAGMRTVPGSFSLEPTRVVPDEPTPGASTLVWENIGDAQPGSHASVSYRIAPDAPATPGVPAGPVAGDVVSAEATALASTDEHRVPDPDAAPEDASSKWTERSSASGSARVVPVQVTLSSDAADDQVLRGPGHATTYTLRVANAPNAPTGSVVVEDHLAAPLEFLGCGTTEHGERAARGASLRLDQPLAEHTGCRTPSSVDTVELDPDGNGPLEPGTYTRVRWELGDLAPGEQVSIDYAAVVAERANAPWAADAPDPACLAASDACEQLANLDNNTGEWTAGTTPVANTATVSGEHRGSLAEGVEASSTWSRSALTLTADDLTLTKAACNAADNGAGTGRCANGIVGNGPTDWELVVRAGAYREVTDAVVTDRLPEQLRLVEGTAQVSIDGKHSVPLDGTHHDDTLRWHLGTIAPSSTVRITYRTTTDHDIVVFDTLRNDASVSGTSVVRDGIDDTGPQPVHAAADDELTSTWNTLERRVLSGDDAARHSIDGERCSVGWNDADALDGRPDAAPSAAFARGDLVCSELRVELPEGVQIRDGEITDFLPAGVRYVGVTTFDDHDAEVPSRPELDLGYGNAVLWRVAADREPGERVSSPKGTVFHVVVGARVLDAPSSSGVLDGPSRGATEARHQLEVSGLDSDGVRRTGARVSSGHRVAEPQLTLGKDVVDAATGHLVRAGQRVPFRIEVANVASPLRPAGSVGESSRLRDADMAEESPNAARGGARDDAAGLTLFGDTERSTRRTTSPDSASLDRSSHDRSSHDRTGQRLSTGMRINRAVAGQPNDALDVLVVDTLPDGLGCDTMTTEPAVTLTPRDGVGSGLDEPTAATLRSECDDSTDTLTAVIDRVPAGYVASITYELTVAEDAAAGAEYTNRAHIQSFGEPSGLSLHDPGTALADEATVSLPPATLTAAGPSVDADVEATATIGERVPLAYDLTVPAGTSVRDVAVEATMPPGLALVPDSVVADPGLEVERRDADGLRLVGTSWTNFGDDPVTVRISFDVVLTDVDTNSHGAVVELETELSTAVDSTAVDGTAGSDAASATSAITVVEPDLSVTSAHTPDGDALLGGLVGGRVVDHEVVVANAEGRPAPASTTVVECVPDGLGNIELTGDFAGLVLVTPPSAPCADGTTRIEWDLSGLAITAEQPARLSYRTTVAAPMAASTPLATSTTLTAASNDGPDARTSYRATATDTIRIAGPTLLSAAASPTVVAGGTVDRSITIVLPDGLTLHDATVVDVLPPGVELTGQRGAEGPLGAHCVTDGVTPHLLDPDGARFGWFLGDLSAVGGECRIELGVSARDGADSRAGDVLVGDVDLNWNVTERDDDITVADSTGFDMTVTASDEVTVVEPELRIEKTSDDEDGAVEAGQQVRYTLTVTNTGTSAAHGIVVTDEYPVGLGAPSDAGGTCDAAAAPTLGEQRATWTLHPSTDVGAPGLAAGESCTITYAQQVDAATSGSFGDGDTLENDATITEYFAVPGGSGDDSARRYDSESASHSVTTRLARLGIDKATASGDEVSDADLGSPVGWELVVTNDGRGTAFGIDVTDSLPVNWTFDEGSVGILGSDGSGCLPDATQTSPLVVTDAVEGGLAQRIEWQDLCDLGPRSAVTLTFTATPGPASADIPGLVDAAGEPVLHPNTATVDGADAGGTALEGDRDDAAARLRTADLAVRLSHSGGFVVGAEGTFHVDVVNRGADAATGPIVAETRMPAGVTATSALGDGWRCSLLDGGATVRCEADGPLPASISLARVVIGVDVTTAAVSSEGTVRADATVSSATPDPDASNSTAEAETTVTRVSDLLVTATADAATPPAPGAIVAHRLEVTNAGPSPANGPIQVVDDLPDGLRLVSVGGTGWDCAASTVPATAATGTTSFSGTAPTDHNGRVVCTRDGADAPAGSTYEPIDVVTTVDPAARAAGSIAPAPRVGALDSAAEGDSDSGGESAPPAEGARLAVAKDDGGAIFTAGQHDARYYITVSNPGTAAEQGPVEVTDRIDEHLQLVRVDAPGWDCETEAGTGFGDGERGGFRCVWNGEIAVGRSLGMITVVVRVDPAAVADPRPGTENLVHNRVAVVGGTDTDERADTVETPVVPSASLTVDVAHDTATDPWTVGSIQRLTLTVANDGPSAEYGPVVVDQVLPAGFSHVDAAGDGWDCELREGAGRGPNGTVHCVAGRDGLDERAPLLAAGDRLAPIQVDVDVLPDAAPVPQSDPDVVTNRVAVRASVEGAIDLTEHIGTDSVPIRPLADLHVATTVGDEPFQVGSTGQIDVTVTNDGPNVSAAPIAVDDTLPEGVTFVSAEGDDWTCTAPEGDGPVRCEYARTLGPDESTTVTLTVAVDGAAWDLEQGDDAALRSTVEVSAATVDPEDGNDTATVELHVVPLVDLAVEKTHDGDFSVGATGDFDVVVRNLGPNRHEGRITVTDSLPDGLVFMGASGDGWTCEPDEARTVIACVSDAPVDPGAAMPSITLVVDVDPAAEGGVTNTVTVSTELADADPLERLRRGPGADRAAVEPGADRQPAGRADRGRDGGVGARAHQRRPVGRRRPGRLDEDPRAPGRRHRQRRRLRLRRPGWGPGLPAHVAAARRSHRSDHGHRPGRRRWRRTGHQRRGRVDRDRGAERPRQPGVGDQHDRRARTGCGGRLAGCRGRRRRAVAGPSGAHRTDGARPARRRGCAALRRFHAHRLHPSSPRRKRPVGSVVMPDRGGPTMSNSARTGRRIAAAAVVVLLGVAGACSSEDRDALVDDAKQSASSAVEQTTDDAKKAIDDATADLQQSGQDLASDLSGVDPAIADEFSDLRTQADDIAKDVAAEGDKITPETKQAFTDLRSGVDELDQKIDAAGDDISSAAKSAWEAFRSSIEQIGQQVGFAR